MEVYGKKRSVFEHLSQPLRIQLGAFDRLRQAAAISLVSRWPMVNKSMQTWQQQYRLGPELSAVARIRPIIYFEPVQSDRLGYSLMGRFN